jgi:hypothetical protein
MLKILSPFESGNFEIAPSALEQSKGRFMEIINAVAAIDDATRGIPLVSAVLSKPDVPLPYEKQQPSGNYLMQGPTDNTPLSVQETIEQSAYDTAFRSVIDAYDNTVPSSYQNTPQTSTASTVTTDHPNQGAINEAYLAALAAHDEAQIQVPEDLKA